jgi:hypothetical protein
MKNTKDYVDSLFAGYEQTKELADFKEELLSNLNDKISNLVKKGMSEQAAFDKATSELGDISALADEISLKKKQEVLEDAYMDIKRYMTPKRVAGYVAFGVVFAFGLVVALVAYLAIRQDAFEFGDFDSVFPFIVFDVSLISALGVLLAFIPVAIAGFTFLGVTQEMPDRYPFTKKRAIWYAVAAWALSFSLFLAPLTYFATSGYLMAAVATLIPFFLPSIGLLVFLVLTEQNHLKPWAEERYSAQMRKSCDMWTNGETAFRFGMFSGAIWIFAFALFFVLGFAISGGFKFSWLTFVFAVAVQLVVQGVMYKDEKADKEGGEK